SSGILFGYWFVGIVTIAGGTRRGDGIGLSAAAILHRGDRMAHAVRAVKDAGAFAIACRAAAAADADILFRRADDDMALHDDFAFGVQHGEVARPGLTRDNN